MKTREDLLKEREILNEQLTPLEREACRALGFVERAAMLARLNEAVQLHDECLICLTMEDDVALRAEVMKDRSHAEAIFVKEALMLELLDGISA